MNLADSFRAARWIRLINLLLQAAKKGTNLVVFLATPDPLATALGVVLGVYPYFTLAGAAALAIWIVVTLASRYVLGRIVAGGGAVSAPLVANLSTSRALDDVAGTKTVIWPGIDIDVPTPRARCTPESVRAETSAALRAGAQGVLLSRAYLEMKPENLRGAGQALEEFGAV